MLSVGGARCWIIPGKLENWTIALRNRAWGLGPRLKFAWDDLEAGDTLFFYVSAPVSGVVGTGKVAGKYIDEEPLWPEEVKSGVAIYPFRLSLAIDSVLEPDDWLDKAVAVRDIPVRVHWLSRVGQSAAHTLLERLAAVTR